MGRKIKKFFNHNFNETLKAFNKIEVTINKIINKQKSLDKRLKKIEDKLKEKR